MRRSSPLLSLLLLPVACDTVSERPMPQAAPARPVVIAPSAPPPRPPATWKGEVIEWSELQPLLAERAGAVVLEEALLDRQLAKLLQERGLKADEARVNAERDELLRSLSGEPERAERLLADLRAVQGLGERRWNALLRRNASARLLVQDQVKVTAEAVEANLDTMHGARRRCRVIAVRDLKACADVKRDLDAGKPFGEVAVERSTDRSAARGGMVNPVSRLDPTWPGAFRQTLWALPPGGTSAPVLVGDTYVIVHLEEELPASPPADPAAARATAEREARRAQERLQMETLIEGLRAAQRDAVVFDPALHDAWTRVRNAAR
jgi:parvulin-like peptidyl-prolyl isomerase